MLRTAPWGGVMVHTSRAATWSASAGIPNRPPLMSESLYEEVVSSWFESAEHKSDHGDVNEGFTGFGQGFVVFAQAATTAKPGGGSLDDPTPGQHGEVGHCSRQPV